VLREEPAPALPVHTLPGAVDRILDLGGPGTLQDAFTLVEFAAGDQFEVGPFQVQTRQLPHWVPNAGIRLAADGQVLAYTGDTGPSPAIVELARGANLFLAEASFPEQVPADAADYLSSARQAGKDAARAGVDRLLLTHLLPGTAPGLAEAAARATFTGEAGVAHGGLVADLGP
jgi:ribonuclease BN (tRNA processing enzyme)